MQKAAAFALLAASALADDRPHCTGLCQRAQNPAFGSPKMEGAMEEKRLRWAAEREAGLIGTTASEGAASCSNGNASSYPCENIDMLAFISLDDLGAVARGDSGNDIWGWTAEDGTEIAVVCAASGTSFVDVTDPVNPSVLGFLPTHTVPSSWRDAKVFKGRAYIGSEASNHGLQVFDMHTLLDMERKPVGAPVTTLTETAWYGEFGSSHNIVLNEETGFVYAVGSRTCDGGLHVVDVNSPDDPVYAGCFAEDGYCHDAECVIYHGPDAAYQGREICFNYDEDTLTIVDVTDKSDMKLIGIKSYEGYQYTHQGWLSADQSHLLLNDELDEQRTASLNGHTRTLIWDVSDLSDPVNTGTFISEETSIDHNLYIENDYAFESNYCSGLRILTGDNDAIAAAELSQVAYFNAAPECSTADFSGTWSVYPYFESGTIVLNSIEKGLFVLQANLPGQPRPVPSLAEVHGVKSYQE